MEDVVRTRIYLVNLEDTLPVSKAHGRVFDQIKPVNTLLQVGGLVGDYLVEIEADALIRNDNSPNQIEDFRASSITLLRGGHEGIYFFQGDVAFLLGP